MITRGDPPCSVVPEPRGVAEGVDLPHAPPVGSLSYRHRPWTGSSIDTTRPRSSWTCWSATVRLGALNIMLSSRPTEVKRSIGQNRDYAPEHDAYDIPIVPSWPGEWESSIDEAGRTDNDGDNEGLRIPWEGAPEGEQADSQHGQLEVASSGHGSSEQSEQSCDGHCESSQTQHETEYMEKDSLLANAAGGLSSWAPPGILGGAPRRGVR